MGEIDERTLSITPEIRFIADSFRVRLFIDFRRGCRMFGDIVEGNLWNFYDK